MLRWTQSDCRCNEYKGMALYYGPGPNGIVYLHRPRGDVKLCCKLKSYMMKDCLRRFVSWTKISNFTLDIALFSIFHREIITAIVKAQKRGVTCRVLVYRHMLTGEKQEKHEMYMEILKKAGVQVRYVSATALSGLIQRLVLIDCSDPMETPPRPENEEGIIFGEQSCYLTPHTLVKDMADLTVMKYPPNETRPWRMKFDKLWNNLDADSDRFPSDHEEPVAGPSHMNVPPRQPTFFGWANRARQSE